MCEATILYGYVTPSASGGYSSRAISSSGLLSGFMYKLTATLQMEVLCGNTCPYPRCVDFPIVPHKANDSILASCDT